MLPSKVVRNLNLFVCLFGIFLFFAACGIGLSAVTSPVAALVGGMLGISFACIIGGVVWGDISD